MAAKNTRRSASDLSTHSIEFSESIPEIVTALLDWFRHNARDLPWRKTVDPYAIWVSEIMLQQTQVKTVIPYWERWMKAFPDLNSLARTNLDRVLKHWEGLGYYSRARNLHQAARFILDEFAGEYPRDLARILLLPGVGRYTAGAVASLAFNQAVPVLDGNVIRVLTRLGAIPIDPRNGPLREQLWKDAKALVVEASLKRPSHAPRLAGNCSALNQALMELGATVCTPRIPACSKCPVGAFCKARHMGKVEEFPRITQRARTQRRFVHAFVVERDGRVLVGQRPPDVVNAGLWEFPNMEIEDGRNLDPADRLADTLGVKIIQPVPLTTIHHSITRYRFRVEAFLVRLSSSTADLQPKRSRWNAPPSSGFEWKRFQWATLRKAESLAMASAHGKILKAWKSQK